MARLAAKGAAAAIGRGRRDDRECRSDGRGSHYVDRYDFVDKIRTRTA